LAATPGDYIRALTAVSVPQDQPVHSPEPSAALLFVSGASIIGGILYRRNRSAARRISSI
jgi:hypothetical protein